MKKAFLFKAFICVAIAWVTNMQKPLAQNAQLVQEVNRVNEQLRKAMVDADGATLNKLTSGELSYGHSGGKVQDKKEFVASIVNGESDFVSISLTDQTVSVMGNTAIVRHTLSAATNDKGKGPGMVKLNILLVWVKVKNQWLLLARQAVKAPETTNM